MVLLLKLHPQLIVDKEKVMIEASERALKTKALFDKKDFKNDSQ